ncbi:hypothetical protein EMPG_15045 [Blastomyces silverae]|uniref:Uncharacterized protein n=1 Tax=Blastomyces silverae TaxID=2060906 RepID=A0A0H1BDU9_9EURO|nr:hypothetical protein EMPG_15045 [Blastomyces silverae]
MSLTVRFTYRYFHIHRSRENRLAAAFCKGTARGGQSFGGGKAKESAICRLLQFRACARLQREGDEGDEGDWE